MGVQFWHSLKKFTKTPLADLLSASSIATYERMIEVVGSDVVQPDSACVSGSERYGEAWETELTVSRPRSLSCYLPSNVVELN